jgi:hypothetical protein
MYNGPLEFFPPRGLFDHISLVLQCAGPGSHHSTICFSEINLFGLHVEVRISGTHFLYLAHCTHCPPDLRRWQDFILLCGRAILHCVYVPHFLHLLVRWWIPRLIPYLSYCEWCHSEHRSTTISSPYWCVSFEYTPCVAGGVST